ncbi:hypothetical protein VIGAN_01419100 [Vigna angularis var. angularis]|uniref:Uncharacterized protein n=1 Tax=Vigna angularis var. angularis TaxID=157739 RepID=A0A0S3R6I2_PHAAN|nr:hypothetical protein VIGAN_01419100 [Vigna angularis var. angularis]
MKNMNAKIIKSKVSPDPLLQHQQSQWSNNTNVKASHSYIAYLEDLPLHMFSLKNNGKEKYECQDNKIQGFSGSFPNLPTTHHLHVLHF